MPLTHAFLFRRAGLQQRQVPLRGLLALWRACATAAGPEEPYSIPLNVPAFTVWGSNTGVGKTLVSAALAHAHQGGCASKTPATSAANFLYLKPVQTGPPGDWDATLVAAALSEHEDGGQRTQPAAAEHALQAAAAGQDAAAAGGPPLPVPEGEAGEQSRHRALTLFAWQRPVSPHHAVSLEGRGVSDETVRGPALAELQRFSQRAGPGSLALLEAAGGVASPGPSGTLQCDLWRPLRLPAVLVGDGRLGGISATLAALELLLGRGYDVPFVVVCEGVDAPLSNAEAVAAHAAPGTRVLRFPRCPADVRMVTAKGRLTAAGLEWVQSCVEAPHAHAPRLMTSLLDYHSQRVRALEGLPGRALRALWYPFTQHSALGPRDLTTIDARCGDRLAIVQPPNPAPNPARNPKIYPTQHAAISPAEPPQPAVNFKGEEERSASGARRAPEGESGGVTGGAAGAAGLQVMGDAPGAWWTQGLSDSQQQRVVGAMARGAARYGHVLHPQTAVAPVVAAAEALLAGPGRGWAHRAFFTDDGSTAIEVALKMAFRAFLAGRPPGDPQPPGGLRIVGIRGGYHGDTLGAQDAVPESIYAGPRQTPWYQERGCFLDGPTVNLFRGQWRVAVPPGDPSGGPPDGAQQQAATTEHFHDLEALLAGTVQGTRKAATEAYDAAISRQLDAWQRQYGAGGLGALLLEPMVQAAGGMVLMDPLFQQRLALLCRGRGIPVIFDEVFSGLWRLGRVAASEYLAVQPDIACYAKLLTGGLMPLAATLAQRHVFEAFLGPGKADALLHGHSFSGNTVGCAAAVEALGVYTNPSLNPNFCTPERCGNARGQCTRPCGRLLDLWDGTVLKELSHLPQVAAVRALGTLLAVELDSPAGGYAAQESIAVCGALRAEGVFARPLGNVVYLLAAPVTEPRRRDALQQALLRVLTKMSK